MTLKSLQDEAVKEFREKCGKWYLANENCYVGSNIELQTFIRSQILRAVESTIEGYIAAVEKDLLLAQISYLKEALQSLKSSKE